MERIGVYCGVFNPPHTGHLTLARQAKSALGLSRVLLIPDRQPPHRELPPFTPSWPHRRALLELSMEPGLEPADLAGEPSYAWETIRNVRDSYPDAEIFLLLGPDKFANVDTWQGFDRFCRDVTLTLFTRGKALSDRCRALEALGCTVSVVEGQSPDISSTQLRRLLAFGCGWEFLTPKAAAYIRSQGLYCTAENWKNLPMEKLEQVVISLLDPGRIAHVLGCRDTAVKLAQHWGADSTDAARAGLLHDVTKALDGPLQLTLCRHYGKILSEFSRKYPKTLHALTGSLVAERIFGENSAVVSAVCHHTTGKANMSVLEKIIYVADYMEPNRKMPGVDRLRELAFADLDGALKLGLQMTLEHLNRQGSEVSPESREALAYLNS